MKCLIGNKDDSLRDITPLFERNNLKSNASRTYWEVSVTILYYDSCFFRKIFPHSVLVYAHSTKQFIYDSYAALVLTEEDSARGRVDGWGEEEARGRFKKNQRGQEKKERGGGWEEEKEMGGKQRR